MIRLEPETREVRIILAVLILSMTPLWGAHPLAAVAPGASSTKAGVAAASIRMLAKPSRPPVGGTVLIKLKIKSKELVSSAPFHLHFDSAVLKFERAVEGNFLDRGGAQTAFFAELASTGDEVIVGLSRLGQGAGAKGKGTLCILEFTALAPGDAGFAFRNEKLKDAASIELPSVFDTRSVVVR